MARINDLSPDNIAQLSPGDFFTLYRWKSKTGRRRAEPQIDGPFLCRRIDLSKRLRNGRRYWEVSTHTKRHLRTLYLIPYQEGADEPTEVGVNFANWRYPPLGYGGTQVVLADPQPGERVPPLNMLSLAKEYRCAGCRKPIPNYVWQRENKPLIHHWQFHLNDGQKRCWPCHAEEERKRFLSDDPGHFWFTIEKGEQPGTYFVASDHGEEARKYSCRIRFHGDHSFLPPTGQDRKTKWGQHQVRRKAGGHNWYGVSRTDIWFRDEMGRSWWGYSLNETGYRCRIIKGNVPRGEGCNYSDYMHHYRGCRQLGSAVIRYLSVRGPITEPRFIKCCQRHATAFLKRVDTAEIIPDELRWIAAA